MNHQSIDPYLNMHKTSVLEIRDARESIIFIRSFAIFREISLSISNDVMWEQTGKG